MTEPNGKIKTAAFEPQFMIVPSLSCPASCAYCFGPNDGPSMDVPMTGRVFDFIESIVCETGQRKISVMLHGGEPLAAGHEVIEALLLGLHEHFGYRELKIGIQSNLWLLDDKFCDLFAKYKVDIGTSLDGPQRINDYQRGEGSFDKIMRGIRLARSHGLGVGCIATFTSKSAPHWREIFDFFLAENLHFSVHPSVAPISAGLELALTPEQYALLFEEMFGYYIENRRKIKISSFDQICRGAAANGGRVCTFRDCFGMFLAIDPNGDIFSCQRFAGKPEFRLGNIADKPSMLELINSPMAKRLLEREKRLRETCGDCEHFDCCKGGCAYNTICADAVRDPLCGAYREIFSSVKQKLCDEMVSTKNMDAVAELGPVEDGNPLLRKGPVTELSRERTHPYDTARTVKRIIAAYELARSGEMNKTAAHLAETGICRTCDSALASLEAMRKGMEPGGKLNKLYLHVTWNCQLRCSHCYASAGNDAPRVEMGADSILRITKEAAACGFKEAVITGGEPLLHEERGKLLTAFAELRRDVKPMKLILRTNLAMPLSAEDNALLAAAFDNIVVSVDGDRETHDVRRGEGSYEKAVGNIKAYLSFIGKTTGRASTELSLAASMRAEQVNGEAGAAVKDLARQLGVSCKFRPLLPLGRELKTGETIMPEPLRAYLQPIEIIEQGFWPVMSCGIGQNLYIEPSGDCFPCYSYHKPNSFLGNTEKEGLRNVVESGRFKELQLHTVDTNCKCRTCEYRYICGGACRAWGGDSTQYDLDAAPLDCEGLRSRAEGLYRAAVEYLPVIPG